jgi:glycosyltransferase involved in cell wall biosynthesis
LVIIGNICDDARKLIKEYQNEESIRFVGFADPREEYKQSDIFVFPSLEEGSALVTYEALASGLPLITTFNSGSIIRDGKEGIIIPIRDVNAIKEKILYFYKNPKEIKKMAKNARKRVEEFTWKDYEKKVAQAYKKILKNR